jgi:hypothetical protein
MIEEKCQKALETLQIQKYFLQNTVEMLQDFIWQQAQL